MNAWLNRRTAAQDVLSELSDNRISASTREEMGSSSLIMDWQSQRNKKWLRIIALILTVCFIHQDLVWAQGGTPIWAKAPNGSFNFKANGQNTPINIPKDIAVTKEVYNAPSRTTNDERRTTIINIQDAHDSFTAQESISSILDSLVTNYDLKLVAIEGSSGYIDTSLLRTFPDSQIRKDTAKYLMKKGKLSAGEFFSITSEKEIALYGIEDKPLYTENVEQFRKICAIKDATHKDIANLKATLDALKDKAYSDELKTLDKNSVLHKDGKIAFTDRWAYISALGEKFGVRYGQYENLAKMVESLRMEKGLDFAKANKERDALIDILSKKMAKPDLEQLVLKSLAFKQSKISQGDFYLFLQELASRYGIDPVPYSQLINYTNYITLYESIDIPAIFEEIKNYEDAIKEKLFKNDDQKKLHDWSRFLDTVQDLYELKLTNSDLEAFISTKDNFNPETLSELIRTVSLKYDVTISGDYDLATIFENIPVALEFYKTAESRNSAMLANTINKMQKEGQSVAALITGGYHSKGLSALLKQKETSYLVILPKFDASKGERPYVAILTNKKEPYEELLESGKYSLISNDYLKDSLADPKQAQAFILDAVITSIGQAVIEHRDVESVKKLWLNGYTTAYESLKTKGIIREPADKENMPRARFTLPAPIYRVIVKNDDGTIENRSPTAQEMELFIQKTRKAHAAKGTQAVSIEDRLVKLETTTKDMLVESIADGINKANAKKDFDSEFSKVASRKQAYKNMGEDDKKFIKSSVRAKIGVGSSQLAVTSEDIPPLPEDLGNVLKTVGGVSLVEGKAAMASAVPVESVPVQPALPVTPVVPAVPPTVPAAPITPSVPVAEEKTPPAPVVPAVPVATVPAALPKEAQTYLASPTAMLESLLQEAVTKRDVGRLKAVLGLIYDEAEKETGADRQFLVEQVEKYKADENYAALFDMPEILAIEIKLRLLVSSPEEVKDIILRSCPNLKVADAIAEVVNVTTQGEAGPMDGQGILTFTQKLKQREEKFKITIKETTTDDERLLGKKRSFEINVTPETPPGPKGLSAPARGFIMFIAGSGAILAATVTKAWADYSDKQGAGTGYLGLLILALTIVAGVATYFISIKGTSSKSGRRISVLAAIAVAAVVFFIGSILNKAPQPARQETATAVAPATPTAQAVPAHVVSAPATAPQAANENAEEEMDLIIKREINLSAEVVNLLYPNITESEFRNRVAINFLTKWHEENGFNNLKQRRGGPARGPGIEVGRIDKKTGKFKPATGEDILRFVGTQENLKEIVVGVMGMPWPEIAALEGERLGREIINNSQVGEIFLNIRYMYGLNIEDLPAFNPKFENGELDKQSLLAQAIYWQGNFQKDKDPSVAEKRIASFLTSAAKLPKEKYDILLKVARPEKITRVKASAVVSVAAGILAFAGQPLAITSGVFTLLCLGTGAVVIIFTALIVIKIKQGRKKQPLLPREQKKAAERAQQVEQERTEKLIGVNKDIRAYLMNEAAKGEKGDPLAVVIYRLLILREVQPKGNVDNIKVAEAQAHEAYRKLVSEVAAQKKKLPS